MNQHVATGIPHSVRSGRDWQEIAYLPPYKRVMFICRDPSPKFEIARDFILQIRLGIARWVWNGRNIDRAHFAEETIRMALTTGRSRLFGGGWHGWVFIEVSLGNVSSLRRYPAFTASRAYSTTRSMPNRPRVMLHSFPSWLRTSLPKSKSMRQLKVAQRSSGSAVGTGSGTFRKILQILLSAHATGTNSGKDCIRVCNNRADAAHWMRAPSVSSMIGGRGIEKDLFLVHFAILLYLDRIHNRECCCQPTYV